MTGAPTKCGSTPAIGGTPVHYLRFDGEQPGALPIVLTHGWPSTFLELCACRKYHPCWSSGLSGLLLHAPGFGS
ncbi:epoxide hydrolase N-terminal domain-containing protein [Nonomuraea sp. ZG12]|uniref:epoxide hydrolase N-terminal domain-containing protein n=1 Tax=Nonomuraea sp. ZG12 TaxID=3452207 RepID=UPI003F8CE59C